MRKRKYIHAVLCGTLAVFLLAGCGKNESAPSAGGGTNETTSSVSGMNGLMSGFPDGISSGAGDSTAQRDTAQKDTAQKDTAQKDTGVTEAAVEEKQKINWAVEPFLEVDDISVDDVSDDARAEKVSVVKKNDKYGFIRYDGMYAVEPYFSIQTPFPYCLVRDDGTGEPVQVEVKESGELRFSSDNYGWGGPGAFYYYLDPQTLDIYEEFGGTTLYEGNKALVVDQIASKDDSAGFLSITGGSKYGLADKKGLILPCDYEDGYGRTSESARYVAMKSHGKWAYFAINGKQLTDFLYDPFTGHVQDGDCATRPDGYERSEHFVPYLPTEGYIAVRIGEQCGYIDVEGNEIYPIGTFEDVRPVHGGRAWAMKDGKWGVLKFPDLAVRVPEISDGDYIKLH